MRIKAIAAVGLRTALKYRKSWDRNNPSVKMLQSFMPKGNGSKPGYRLYIPIETAARKHFSVPPAVSAELRKQGFVITDYLAKKCVKASDKEQKNEFNIGKVVAKNPIAKAAFDNDPQLQNSKDSKINVVISCHPYDIIGMSTGRDWDRQSCMRLDDAISNKGDRGSNAAHVSRDVSAGTMVAYAVRETDSNVQSPLCRCLLKPFHGENGDILFRRETSIYGNNVPGFGMVLSKFLRELNAKAKGGAYRLAEGLYDDGVGTEVHYSGVGDLVPVGEEFADDPEGTLEKYVNHDEPDRVRKLVSAIIEQRDNLPDTLQPKVIEFFQNNAAAARALQNSMVTAIPPFLQGLVEDKYQLDMQALKEHYGDTIPLKEASIFIGDVEAVYFVNRDPEGYKFLLETVEREIAASPSEDLPFKTVVRLNRFLKGVYRAPTKEELLEFPLLGSVLHSICSALRYEVLLSAQKYQKSIYAILEAVDQPKCDDTALIVHVLTQTYGKGVAFLLYIMDNPAARIELPGSLDPSDVNVVATRRILKALERVESPAATEFYDVTMYSLMYRLLSYTAAFHMDRYVRDALAKWAIENQHRWADLVSPGSITRLANFSLPVLMVSEATTNTTNGFRTANAIFNYRGEKLTPVTRSSTYVVQYAYLLAKCYGNEKQIVEHFNFDLPDVRDFIAQHFYNMRHFMLEFRKIPEGMTKPVDVTKLGLVGDIIETKTFDQATLTGTQIDAVLEHLTTYYASAAADVLEDILDECSFRAEKPLGLKEWRKESEENEHDEDYVTYIKDMSYNLRLYEDTLGKVAALVGKSRQEFVAKFASGSTFRDDEYDALKSRLKEVEASFADSRKSINRRLSTQRRKKKADT